jgi:hypothetical protein
LPPPGIFHQELLRYITSLTEDNSIPARPLLLGFGWQGPLYLEATSHWPLYPKPQRPWAVPGGGVPVGHTHTCTDKSSDASRRQATSLCASAAAVVKPAEYSETVAMAW